MNDSANVNSDSTSTPYTLPSSVPTIPKRPPKPAARAASPEDDIEIVNRDVRSMVPSASVDKKRSAPEEDDSSIGKKQKMAKVDASTADDGDDDIQIL